MQSPFPGMDPFIEAFGLWEDFHTKLIGEIERNLSLALPERYLVRAGERTYIDYVDPASGSMRRSAVLPDVSIRRPTAGDAAATTAAVMEAGDEGVVMHVAWGTPVRELYLEILDLDPRRRLITCIEVLSPSNKLFGSVGWDKYASKRQFFVQGYANLVEIDLVRGGRRLPMDEAWPDSPYSLLVMRKESAPACSVNPVHFEEPLPAITIPLAPPDSGVRLSLQPLIDAVYSRSRYQLDINYREPLDPPLLPEQLAWLDQQLKKC